MMLLSLAVIAATMTFVSCGDDDPEAVIDYYVDIEEQFLVNASTSTTDRYISPVTRMNEAIRKAYPSPNETGNDAAIIEACDKEHQDYLMMYTGRPEHFTCKLRVMRARKIGTIVKQSEDLRTYTYDINPSSEFEEDD